MKTQDWPVCVFAKPPVPGSVKTRLGAHVGGEAAAEMARALFDDTWAVIRATPGLRPVLATTDPGRPGLEVPAGEVWGQGGGDLGARVERVLRRGLARAPVAVAMGADTFGLDAACLARVQAGIAGLDALLAPSTDGGFWWLAVRRLPVGTLAGVPWSTARTSAAVRGALVGRGLSLAEGERAQDLDEVTDLAGLLRAGASHPAAGRAVALARRWAREGRGGDWGAAR